MKKLFLIIPVVLLLIAGIGCAVDPAPPPAAQTFATTSSVDQKVAAINAALAAKADQSALDALSKKVDNLDEPDTSNLYTKAQVDAKLSDLNDKVAALEVKVSQLSGGTTPTPTPTPTGVVSYSIQNPQQWYQFTGTTNIVVMRIFNNTAQSQKVRPQITLNTHQGQSAGTLTTVDCIATSNSQGQTNVTFSPNAFPTGNVTSVVFFANGGGFDTAGNYLLGSGVQMDVYLSITVTSSNAVLWTVNVTGTNNPL